MRILVVVLCSLLAGLILFGSWLLLPACGLSGGFFAAFRYCSGDEASAPQDEINQLSLRRTEFEREISRLQSELAMVQCQSQLPEATGDVDSTAWRENDLAVLEGCWALDQVYLLNQIATGEITEIRDWSVCYDDQGHGTQTLRSTQGVICESPISGAFAQNGTLEMRDPGNVPCSDNSFIYRRNITCNLTAERTIQCTDMQPETGTGSQPYRMRRN